MAVKPLKITSSPALGAAEGRRLVEAVASVRLTEERRSVLRGYAVAVDAAFKRPIPVKAVKRER